MPNYSKGKIYKILNNIDDEIYIGSAVEALSLRMAKHRSCATRYSNLKVHSHMRNIGIDNCYIELVENYPCNDIYELRAREGHFIRESGTLNRLIAGRTFKQYYQDNKERFKQYQEYNKEHIKHRTKQYYEDNKEHLLNYTKQYKEEHK